VGKPLSNVREAWLALTRQEINYRSPVAADIHRHNVVSEIVMRHEIFKKPREMDAALLVANLVSVAIG
jgi:hypothetical protein